MRDAFFGGAAAVLGFAKAVLPAAQFQDQLNMMKTGGEENIRVVEQMEQSALRLNKELAGGLNDSLAVLKKARRLSGLAGKELEIMAGNTMILTKRFEDLDQEKLMASQVQLMRDFGVSAGTAGDMVGYLAAQGGDLRGELLEAIHEYSPQMKSLGFDIRQMVSTTKAALEGGWSVDKGLDAIKEAGLKLRELDKDSKSALGELGLSNVGEQLKKGQITTVQALGKIGPAIAAIKNDTKKFNLFKNIFGTPSEDVGLSGMLDIMGGMNAEAKFAGTMAELKKGVNKGFLGMLNKLRTGFQNLSYTIMSQVLPVLDPFVDMVKVGVDKVQRWAQRFPYLSKTIGIAIIAVLGLILVISTFSLVTGVAHFVIAGIKGIMILWRGVILGVKVALILLKVAGVLGLVGSFLLMIMVIGLVKAAMLTWQGVIWLVNLALNANPIGLVVLGIVALIAAIAAVVVYWDKLKEAGKAAADFLSQAWEKAVAKIMKIIQPFLNIAKKFGIEIGPTVGTGLEEEPEANTTLANAHKQKASGSVIKGASTMIKKYNQSSSEDNSRNVGDVHIHTDKEIKNPATLRSLLFVQGIG